MGGGGSRLSRAIKAGRGQITHQVMNLQASQQPLKAVGVGEARRWHELYKAHTTWKMCWSQARMVVETSNLVREDGGLSWARGNEGDGDWDSWDL